jgi:endonuclease G
MSEIRQPRSTGSGARAQDAATARVDGARAASATTHPVELEALRARYGWAEGGWQDRLVGAADQAGNQDGRVTVSELDRYLANPEDLQFITSSRVEEERAVLAQAGGARAVDQFRTGYQRNLAAAADALGNQDGTLSAAELEGFIGKIREEKGALPSWFPEQKQSAFNSKVAELTGEKDRLRVGGEDRPVTTSGQPVTDAASGVQLIKDYMRLATDNDTRVPPWVSYTMSAADMKVQGEVPRPSLSFHLDPEQPSKPTPRVTDGEYTLLNKARATPETKTPFDRGHMREAESAVNAESMYESFQTNNISTQYGALNQGAWRYLEDGVRELAMAADGKVTVVTGNLFLGQDGRPLPPDQIDRVKTTKGHDGLAIPTHCFKTVLVEKPDGQKQMFAFIVPNDPALAKDITGVKDRFNQEDWRVSVDQVEQLIGRDLYTHLPKATQDRLEKDPAARADFVDRSQFKMANLFMGDRTYELSE